MICESCGLTEFEPDPDGRIICANCDLPAAAVRATCPTPKCGQPIPVNPGPGQHCLVCQKPIKPPKKAA